MWVFVDKKTERILAAGRGDGRESNHDMKAGHLVAVPDQVIELTGWNGNVPFAREVYLRDLRRFTAEEETASAEARTKREEARARAQAARAELATLDSSKGRTLADLAARVSRIEDILRGV